LSETYSVYNTIEVLESGLTFQEAFAELMRRAYCTWCWEHEAGETRIAVHYEGPLPEAYDSVRNLKSPYFRSRVRSGRPHGHHAQLPTDRPPRDIPC
jgi:hypothetical protein